MPMSPSTRLLLLALCLMASWAPPLRAQSLTVQIQGLEGELLENARALLDIHALSRRGPFSAARIRRLHARAPEQIRQALQPFGYYRAQVRGELIEGEADWVARYEVEPGPPATLSAVNVSVTGAGEHDERFRELLVALPLRVGDVLVHARYEQAKEALLRLAGERGYLDARLTRHELRVDPAANRAQAVLELDTGPRYRFGPVDFRQLGPEPGFREDFLRRFVQFAAGDDYSPAALLRLQSALSDSGYFQRVEVRPLRGQAAEARVPVEVELEPRKPRQWRFGLGYGTDTGPRAKITHARRLGRWGHTLGGEALISSNLTSLGGAYQIPLGDPTTEQLAFSGRFSEERTDSRSSRITGASAAVTGLRGDWREVLSLNLEREDYLVGGEDQISRLLYPAVSWTRIRADERVRPSRGDRLRLELRGALQGVLSDASYAQLRAGGKWVRALGEANRLLLRGELGLTWIDDFDVLPASQRFYAGGDTSVRGYGHESLGPENEAGEVVGGENLVVGSAELERTLFGNWSVAAFYDAGNAFNDWDPSLRRGAGVGLRWNSPVGPVRLDFAWALDDPDDDFRVHIVIGPDL